MGPRIYFSIPELHWGWFFVVLFGSIILGEIFGGMWTRKRRSDKKARKFTNASRLRRVNANKSKSSVQNTSTKAHMSKLTDVQILKADVRTLSGMDFERLMELYYIDQGFTIQ